MSAFGVTEAVAVSSVVIALAQATFEYVKQKKANIEIKAKIKQVGDIHARVESKDDIKAVINKQLKLATTREEVVLLQSKSRGDLLYRLGAFFLFISIICPVASAWMYWQIDPVDALTLQKISQLNQVSLELTKNIKITFERDWHLLLGGVTFGFLCLAAARGILNQQAKEMKHYFDVVEKINYFERLSGVCEIKFYYTADGKAIEEDIVNLICDNLLQYNKVIFEEDSQGGSEKATAEVSTIIQDASKVVKVLAN